LTGPARHWQVPRGQHGEPRIDTNPVSRLATDLLIQAWEEYRATFRLLTRSAIGRFGARDWAGLHADTEARLLLYPASISELVVRLGRLSLWQPIPVPAVRRRYLGLVDTAPDREIAETFYNSAIRRFNGSVGVDEAIEFLDLAPPRLPTDRATRVADFAGLDELVGVLRTVLDGSGLRRWSNAGVDANRMAARLRATVPGLDTGGRLTWLPMPFIRNRRAFLVGRLDTAALSTPIVAVAVPGDPGLHLEALLTEADDASIVFGFTRSYFQVDLEEPRAAVGFLHSLLPAKRVDELYTVIGYHRHGKREFYQDLHRTLGSPDARFEPIEGIPGMVMLAFLLKPMNAVFKVIRDRSAPPKQVSRREVLAKYRFVFHQEHGGRLADTQEFEGLALPKRAFEASVAADLEAHARDSIRDAGDRWVFRHLYTERRMIPLDVFLRSASLDLARAAVIDFGRAIKELAAINVFPGDMLAKNFGVTRHGRVVFYDYDEICALTDCTFRVIPESTSYEDELAAEPWFSVRESDVFPEEFERFIRFPEPLHRTFREHHRDLFTAEFWNGVRQRVAGGEITEPAPYGPEHLLQ